jgi:hypothetical protein
MIACAQHFVRMRMNPREACGQWRRRPPAPRSRGELCVFVLESFPPRSRAEPVHRQRPEVVVSSSERSTGSRLRAHRFPGISRNLQKDAVLELYGAKPMRYCSRRLRMEGSRSLFNGAGAMRIERGAPLSPSDGTMTESAQLSRMRKSRSAKGEGCPGTAGEHLAACTPAALPTAEA